MNTNARPSEYVPSEAEVEAAARAAAIHDDYDGCFERVDEYEALLAEFPDDYRSGDERPDSDYEDCEWWRVRARAALVAAHATAPTPGKYVAEQIAQAIEAARNRSGNDAAPWYEAARIARSFAPTPPAALGCDVCGRPSTHVATPGGMRGCDDHFAGRT